MVADRQVNHPVEGSCDGIEALETFPQTRVLLYYLALDGIVHGGIETHALDRYGRCILPYDLLVYEHARSKLAGPEELLLLVGRPYRIRLMKGLGLLAQLFLVILAIGMQRLEGQHCYKHDY